MNLLKQIQFIVLAVLFFLLTGCFNRTNDSAHRLPIEMEPLIFYSFEREEVFYPSVGQYVEKMFPEVIFEYKPRTSTGVTEVEDWINEGNAPDIIMTYRPFLAFAMADFRYDLSEFVKAHQIKLRELLL